MTKGERMRIAGTTDRGRGRLVAQALVVGLAALVVASCSKRTPDGSDAADRSVGTGTQRVPCGRKCSVTLTPVVTLPPPGPTEDFSRFVHVGIAPTHYIVGPSIDLAHIFVFDTDGRLERTLGRKGAGPGEFAAIAGIAALGDSALAAADLFEERVTVMFDNGPVIRVIPTGWSPGTTFLSDPTGGWIVNASIGTPDKFGFALHRISKSGTVVASFDDRTGDGLAGRQHYRVSTLLDNGTIWTSFVDRAIFSHWTVDGQLLATVTPPWAWFPVPDPRAPAQRMDVARPVPDIVGLGDDGNGHLLVLLRRPRPDWEASPSALLLGDREGPAIDVADELKYITFELHVVSASDGTDLATLPLPGYFSQVMDRHYLLQLIPDFNGRLTLRIWDIRVSVAS